MKPHTIEAPHDFKKFEGQEECVLLGVEIVSRTELSQYNVDYNTGYYTTVDNTVRGDTKFFHLPNGSLLLLTFLGCDKIPFTMLKPHKDSTWISFRKKIGDSFKIVVKEQALTENQDQHS